VTVFSIDKAQCRVDAHSSNKLSDYIDLIKKNLEPRKTEPLTTKVIPEILNLNRILSGLTFSSLPSKYKKSTPCSNGQLLQS
jgi:hypothetical protein